MLKYALTIELAGGSDQDDFWGEGARVNLHLDDTQPDLNQERGGTMGFCPRPMESYMNTLRKHNSNFAAAL